MNIFIDESGTNKEVKNSSVVLVCVSVKNKEQVERKVVEIEKSLRIQNFHWANHTWKIRNEFFRLIVKENFYVRAAVMPNPFSEEKFEEAVKSMLVERKINQIVLDGKKSKRYSLRLKKVLRDYGISTKKMRMGNDAAFPCLRLADSFAGLVKAFWNDGNNQKVKEVYSIGKKKIKTTQQMDGQTCR